MKATITIEMNNAAFGSDCVDRGYELARILKKVSLRASVISYREARDETLLDSNGNTVGTFTVSE